MLLSQLDICLGKMKKKTQNKTCSLSPTKHKNCFDIDHVPIYFIIEQIQNHKSARRRYEIILENSKSAKYLGQDENSTNQKLEN